jgi:hypothetical protein
LRIVPTACPSVTVAPVTPESVTVKVSFGSYSVSPLMLTVKLWTSSRWGC